MEGKENVFTVIINDAITGQTTDIAFGTTTTSKDLERLAILSCVVIVISIASYS